MTIAKGNNMARLVMTGIGIKQLVKEYQAKGNNNKIEMVFLNLALNKYCDSMDLLACGGIRYGSAIHRLRRRHLATIATQVYINKHTGNEYAVYWLPALWSEPKLPQKYIKKGEIKL